MASSIKRIGLCTINDKFGLCESDPVASPYGCGLRVASFNLKGGLHTVITNSSKFVASHYACGL